MHSENDQKRTSQLIQRRVTLQFEFGALLPVVDGLFVLTKMNTDLASDFAELKRPKNLAVAILRFLLFLIGAAVLYFIAPNAWGEWRVGLVTGIVAGALWGVSWRWKGDVNRLLAWMIIWLGGMAFWGMRYKDIPSLGALFSMYVGFELIQLLFYYSHRKWIIAANRRSEEAEEAAP